MNHAARASRPMSRTQQAIHDRVVPAGDVQERIHHAALAVLREGGIRRFSQVRVSRRARVRQSHLTYYFPTRHDLLEATTMRFVDHLATGIIGALGDRAAAAHGPLLAHLADAVSEIEHMRMFIGLIVEADKDPTLRAIIVRGTQRLEATLAEALGGERAEVQARVLLAAMWGLGLYGFAMRPRRRSDPTRPYLAWLEEALRSRQAGGSPNGE